MVERQNLEVKRHWCACYSLVQIRFGMWRWNFGVAELRSFCWKHWGLDSSKWSMALMGLGRQNQADLFRALHKLPLAQCLDYHSKFEARAT